jgi:hypothetical protein
MSPEDLTWAHERGRQVVDDLEARGLPVIGDLADLVPEVGLEEGSDQGLWPADITQAELLERTESALAALALSHGRMAVRYRRLARQADGTPVSATTAVRSGLAATAFGLKRTALRWADRSKLLAWAARRYTRPTHGRRR